MDLGGFAEGVFWGQCKVILLVIIIIVIVIVMESIQKLHCGRAKPREEASGASSQAAPGLDPEPPAAGPAT